MVNRYIVGPIGQMYMDEVTTDDLRLLMVPLSKGSSGMYGQLNMLIKNIFNSAEESKVIKENPSKTICARGGKPAKRREALTDEQTAILMDAEASPVEIYLGDNESYGTIVFVMPEKASVPQTWTKACELFVEELWHYTYGENQAEIGIDIARQVSVNGDEPVDCMIIFAKRHYGEEGGDIWTQPVL